MSSRSAAKATLALNAGLCERRERRPDDFLFITNSFRLAIVGQAICPEFVFISAVQICGATSKRYQQKHDCNALALQVFNKSKHPQKRHELSSNKKAR